MPELPEVETVRRRIAPVLEGRTLERVEIEDPRLVMPREPLEVAAELEGEQVARVDRRGKYLIVRFESGELEPYLARKVGAEPLGAFTARALGERLEGRRAPLKAALLDQRTLAGLGNIYVDEALWYAKLNPLRAAGSLDRNELQRLHRAIRKALELGIARQGSTLSDYRLPDGSAGEMQREFRAYGRTDEPCDR